MRDHLGHEVMGFYGGESTKSWGNKTLGTGDILFGRHGAANGGWMYFDRDGVSSAPYLTLGYSDKTVMAFDTGGATLDGYLDIATAGGIYQGTGDPATSSWGTGLRIYNSGGIGRLSTYNARRRADYADQSGQTDGRGGECHLRRRWSFPGDGRDEGPIESNGYLAGL